MTPIRIMSRRAVLFRMDARSAELSRNCKLTFILSGTSEGNKTGGRFGLWNPLSRDILASGASSAVRRWAEMGLNG
jgi:hypothetical protein